MACELQTVRGLYCLLQDTVQWEPFLRFSKWSWMQDLELRAAHVTPCESKDNNSRETSRNKILGASPSHSPRLSWLRFPADARLPCLILLSSPWAFIKCKHVVNLFSSPLDCRLHECRTIFIVFFTVSPAPKLIFINWRGGLWRKGRGVLQPTRWAPRGASKLDFALAGVWFSNKRRMCLILFCALCNQVISSR